MNPLSRAGRVEENDYFTDVLTVAPSHSSA